MEALVFPCVSLKFTVRERQSPRSPSNIKILHLSNRSLSPASVKIIRILLDISFIWSSCSKHPVTRSQVLPSLVNGGLDDPSNLPNFFHQHLERDVRDLTQLTGKNFEEVVFILHLIVKSLMETAGKECK